MEELILVDRNDQEVGTGEKLQIHLEGRLHRAFSIFVFDDDGRLLLQQRAYSKYHSANLWSNTCCGHPRPGEAIEQAAARRLLEEMNFTCDLRKVAEFIYRAQVTEELFEYEYDHVFVGRFNGEPQPCSTEVAAWRWIELAELRQELREQPDCYTYWFKLALAKVPLSESG